MKDTLHRRAGFAALLTLCLCLQLLLTPGAYDPMAIGGTDSGVAPLAVGSPIHETEPNDTYSSATRTYDDYISYGTIRTNTDEDWWRIAFNESGKANFWLGDIPSGCNYDLEVYEPNGITRIAVSSNQGNTPELIRMNVTAGKTYHVRIFSKSGYSASRYCLRIKNYPTIPANAIGVYVTDTDGQPIRNAVVYIYAQRSRANVDMYPDGPFYTNAYGFVRHTGLVAGARYAINVVADGYAAKSYSAYVTPSTEYVTIALARRNTAMLNDPLTGFDASNIWGHSGSCAETCACKVDCTRICPQKYMNVRIPQNFGWRYGTDSRIEFHQALDISAKSTDIVYSIFDKNAKVIQRANFSGCGNTVQIQCNSLYVTYMHLTSYLVDANATIEPHQKIGYAGNTGMVGGAVHVHISISTDTPMWVPRNNDPNDSNVINWDSSQIGAFLDPLDYIS